MGVFAKSLARTSEKIETGFEKAESERTKTKAPGGLTGFAGALARTSEKVESAPKIEDPEAKVDACSVQKRRPAGHPATCLGSHASRMAPLRAVCEI